MLYLDTNILVYSLVNQDSGKMLASQVLINQGIYDRGFKKFQSHISIQIEVLD